MTTATAVALGGAAFVASASATIADTSPKAAPVSHPFLAKSARKPIFATIQHPDINAADLDIQAAAHRTIPSWKAKITSPLRAGYYTYDMVGSSPYATTPSRTTIAYVPIVARIHFHDGTVLDPTQPGNCDPVSPATRFFNSPLFQPASFTSNGVDVSTGVNGGTQFTSAFQRANFWSNVSGTQYGVVLRAAANPVVVDVIAPAQSSQVFSFQITCTNGSMPTINLGTMDINAYDSIVQNLIAKYARPDQLPIVLTYNFVQTSGGGCCIIGYHNAIPVASGTQTYAVGTYNDPGIFTAPIQDIYAWTHEMSEWLDDPFVQAAVSGGNRNNTTPAWGHTGQVSGCQTNLETGDPLTGVATFQIQGNGGFIYSYQDETFHDWFYRTPSTGTGGKFSFQGVFTTDAGHRCV
ncbi:MAG: hypothetical protein ABI306_08905 [Caulobacteraceae bacterium]